jgi:hypothetical protein
VRSGSSCPELTDYLMSEKFGLDWKDEDVRRMAAFRIILSELNAGPIVKHKTHA